jgi:hypothetical protein
MQALVSVRLPCPGKLFDGDNAVAATVHPTHGVQEEDEKPPARADCDRTLARSYRRLDALLVGTEVGLLVDKTPERWQRFRHPTW